MKMPEMDDYIDMSEYYYDLSSYWKDMFTAIAREYYGVHPRDTDMKNYLYVIEKYEEEVI